MAGTAERLLLTLETIRRGLLALIALGLIGSSVELVLIGHYEDSLQMWPLVVAGLTIALVGVVAARPSVGALRAFQFLMLTLIGTGITGVTLHFIANTEFQLEIDPTLSGLPLFRKAIEATAPPALAPGVMVQVGLLGLLYTYKHPVLAEEPSDLSAKEMT